MSCVQAGAHVCDVVGDQAIDLMESNASLEAEFASTSIKPENERSFSFVGSIIPAPFCASF